MKIGWPLILMVLLAAGCARPKEDVLTVTMSLGEEEWAVMRQDIFPIFEKNHGVRIKAHQVSAENLPTKLQALEIGGQASIDVFAQDNMSLAVLVNKGLVEDLSHLRDKLPPELLPNLITAGEFNGTLYFLPFRPNVQIVYYNTRAFKQYGLKVPRNWDQLLSVAKIFHAREGVGRVLLKGFGGNATATQVYEFILQAGGDPYVFNDEGCVRAFTFLQKLAPYLSPETPRAKWDSTNDILARQQAFLAMNWPFGVKILIHDYGLDYIDTYSGWSGPHGKAHVIGGDVFGIPKNATHKELAEAFILFMQSQEVQSILTAKLGWPSIRPDAYTEVPDWQKNHFATVQEALRAGQFRKNIPWWPTYSKYINRAFRDIVFEQKDVRRTLNAYRRELDAMGLTGTNSP